MKISKFSTFLYANSAMMNVAVFVGLSALGIFAVSMAAQAMDAPPLYVLIVFVFMGAGFASYTFEQMYNRDYRCKVQYTDDYQEITRKLNEEKSAHEATKELLVSTNEENQILKSRLDRFMRNKEIRLVDVDGYSHGRY